MTQGWAWVGRLSAAGKSNRRRRYTCVLLGTATTTRAHTLLNALLGSGVAVTTTALLLAASADVRRRLGGMVSCRVLLPRTLRPLTKAVTLTSYCCWQGGAGQGVGRCLWDKRADGKGARFAADFALCRTAQAKGRGPKDQAAGPGDALSLPIPPRHPPWRREQGS